MLYTAKAHTTGGRDGASRSSDGRLDIKLSSPGVAGNGTNPEQLFAVGWSACFIGAIRLAVSKMKITLPADLAIDAEVDLCKADDSYFLQARLNVSLPCLERKVAQALVDAAHQTCPYSKATRGNIDVAITLVCYGLRSRTSIGRSSTSSMRRDVFDIINSARASTTNRQGWQGSFQQQLAEVGIGGIRHELVSVDAHGAEAAADWRSLKSPEGYVSYERTENFAYPGDAVACLIATAELRRERRTRDPQDAIARALNSLPKYVASTTLKTAAWDNTTVIPRDVVEAVRALKREGTGELQVHGSPGLAQTLIANDLVDEYRLWVHPVVLGSGKRLFGSGAVPAALRLSATRTTSTGVAVHTYERADALRYGAFSVDEHTSTERLFKGEFRKP